MKKKQTKKDFPGARKIVDYFQKSGEDYRRIARLFGGEHYKSMISVMRGSEWTARDVRRWNKALDTYHNYKERIRAAVANDKTLITTKKKAKRSIK